MNRFVLIAMVGTLCACHENPTGPELENADLHFGRSHHRFRDGPLRVMTRNVYVGANVDVVLGATDPNQIPVLVAQAYQQLLATNFPERAEALAREIRRTRPHLVGLQEISLIRTQSPGDFFAGNPVPAEDVVFDYLEILMAALKRKGLHYEVVARVQNPDIEVPMLTGVEPPTFDDIRLTDYDVIIARRGVKISDVLEQNYSASLPIPGLGVIPRGFTAVTAKVRRESYRFVNTHLEPAVQTIRDAQAAELITTLSDETQPVVLVGDLNTPAPDGATYQMFLDAGYVDAWTTRRRFGDGLTCCHDPGLMNESANFTTRIDYVLGRPKADGRMRAPLVRILGDHPRERTRNGLWPSDHAGVWAMLQFSSFRKHYVARR